MLQRFMRPAGRLREPTGCARVAARGDVGYWPLADMACIALTSASGSRADLGRG
jgi:hypothetical protein